MIIREYRAEDEEGWVCCRVLSFLDTAYFDNVYRKKERYENPSVELVAESGGKIVGLLDVEYESQPGQVCYLNSGVGAVIWHLAVLPEFRRRGIATSLLNEAVLRLKEQGVMRLEAWTRDDKWVIDWYKKRGFYKKASYLHVYAEGMECDDLAAAKLPKLFLCNCYGHYVGENKEDILKRFKRVHECRLYELLFP
ncbi:MAG TPA: GNAT family N-acetyltransferase [Firmicutes bacterium]|nr:GNAT family N-acetyltransferase [Bacillota bacterium]